MIFDHSGLCLDRLCLDADRLSRKLFTGVFLCLKFSLDLIKGMKLPICLFMIRMRLGKQSDILLVTLPGQWQDGKPV